MSNRLKYAAKSICFSTCFCTFRVNCTLSKSRLLAMHAACNCKYSHFSLTSSHSGNKHLRIRNQTKAFYEHSKVPKIYESLRANQSNEINHPLTIEKP